MLPDVLGWHLTLSQLLYPFACVFAAPTVYHLITVLLINSRMPSGMGSSSSDAAETVSVGRYEKRYATVFHL
jgi:hypothetical protein